MVYYLTLHYTTLNYTALNYTTLYYTTLQVRIVEHLNDGSAPIQVSYATHCTHGNDAGAVFVCVLVC
jgi:hypothetical protein